MPALAFFDQARDELFRRMGLPPLEHGGSPYGAQVGGPGEAERVADMTHRGGAPATLAGGLAAVGNAMGLMGSSAVTTGFGSLAEKAFGVPTGTFGGVQRIPGWYSIDMRGYPPNRYGFAAARRASAEGARSEQRGPGGGYGGSYGGNDPTSKGPGGQLGHI